MKLRFLEHLACPVDKLPLVLQEWETAQLPLSDNDRARAERLGIATREISHEIVSGVLINPRLKLIYPIDNGIPRMLTFSSGVSKAFADRHAERLRRELGSYSIPNESAVPGEQEVLRTFSNEWVNYDWDGQSYWSLTPEAWFRCMRFVLGIERWPVRDKLALEIGIGIGGVADYMARQEGCEMVGVDLGYAVDAGYRHFGQNPFLHIAQASAFALPFANEKFDFVYSFGVIHHTFSTKAAFDSISRLPKRQGRLYIWVYSHHDESRSLKRRCLMALERVLRPMICRLPNRAQSVALAPLVPLYMAHQWYQAKQNSHGAVRYGLREAMHAARDRFTPRFIHRHSEEEVVGWFQDAGFEQISRGSDVPRPDYVLIGFTACTGVSGIRQ